MFDTWITAMKDGSAQSKAAAIWKDKPNWENASLFKLGELCGGKKYFALRYQYEFDEFFAGIFHPNPYLAERSILALHYLVNEEEQAQLNELIDLVCEGAFDEDNELRRGRKHWLKLNRLAEAVPRETDQETARKAEEAIEAICDYCRRILESDDTEFPKDRVLAFIASWQFGYRLAPLVLGLRMKHSDNLGGTEKSLKDQIAPALKATAKLYAIAGTRKESWHRGCLGNFDQYLLSTLAKNGLPLPFEAAEWHEWMDRIDPAERWRLLYLIALITGEGSAHYGDAMIDRLRREGAKSAFWSDRFLTFEILANRFVDLGETEGLPGIIWDLALTEPSGPQAEPGLDMTVRDRLETFILDGIRKGWIGEIPLARVSGLLGSPSTFRQMMASNILLSSVRAGLDISDQCDTMMAYLTDNPSDQGLMTKGSDLKPREPRKGSTDLTKYMGGEKGGFSVNGLSSLISATETGSISYRLALALGAVAEKGHRREEIASLLASLGEKNAAAAAVSESLASRKDI
jgi:hypothetical protein